MGWHLTICKRSVQQIRKWRAYCDPCTTTVFISDDRHLLEWPPRFEFWLQWSRTSKKTSCVRYKIVPLSLLFQLAKYHRNNTNKRLSQWLSYFSKKPCFQWLFALCVCGRDGTRAYFPHTTPNRACFSDFQRFFKLSAQLINCEFLAFLSVFVFKSPHFLTVAVPSYCPFFVKICKS